MTAEGWTLLLGAFVGIVGGYAFGVLINRYARRDERRDNAIADIYKTLMQFYRCLISWSSIPYSKPSSLDSEETTWEGKCRALYEKFLEAYFGNSIWLGEETDDLIDEFTQRSKEVVNEFSKMNSQGRLTDGTKAKDLLSARLTPLQREIKEVLRAEIEASRTFLQYRVVVRKSE